MAAATERSCRWATALFVSLAGCGSQTIVTTVTTSSSTNSNGSSAQSATATAAASNRAKLGDPLTLTGSGGESMAVTVSQVMDPLTVDNSVDQVSNGHRYVGVQIALKNVGNVPYSDSPSNGATLLSNTNEQATHQIVSGGPCANGFQSSAKIAPGETQQGCIAFEMPIGQPPGTFQFTLNSGFADQTGEWTLTAGSASATSASGSGSSQQSSAPSGSSTQCDPNISAGPGTTCPFAENVFKAYAAQLHSTGQTSATVQATSPATGRSYSMTCTNGAAVVCTGGTNAYVTFPLHAAQVY